MGSIVLTTLSVFLGLFFVFVGTLKVTPRVNKEMHREIRRDYVQYAKVFPTARTLGFKVSPKQYRETVGWIEIVSGLILTAFPGKLKQLANVVLLLLTLGSFYTHAVVEDKFERTAPSIVFSLMLTCRLIINCQVHRRDAKEAAKLAATLADAAKTSPVDKKEN